MIASDQDTTAEFRRFTGGADIHTHVLPEIDDGATSLENSLRMLLLAARYGTTTLVATPHRIWAQRENKPDALRKLTADVRLALISEGLGDHLELLPGQEIPLTPETAEELRQGNVLTLGDTGVYALVEAPFENLPDWTPDALAAIVAAGFQPVLAHPERNAVVQREPEHAFAFVQAGALLQLTAMSLTGENGKRAQATARWILDNRLATVVASDSHSPTWRPPTLRGAFHMLREQYDLATARRLCITNPRALATGKPL